MYKSDDKIVVKIDKLDAASLNKEDNVAFYNEQVLGKLEDFQPADKKIKMTVEEKKEFDKLLKNINNSNSYFADILNAIWNNSGDYHNLRRRLFANANLIVNRKKQFEFVRALENPKLAEVEKPKKYYVHLFPGECGYLNKFRDTGDYELDNKDNTSDYCTAFTKEEIAKIPQDALKITDKALEGVEEDE